MKNKILYLLSLVGLVATQNVKAEIQPATAQRREESGPSYAQKVKAVSIEVSERELAKRRGLKEWNIKGVSVYAATRKAAEKKASKKLAAAV